MPQLRAEKELGPWLREPCARSDTLSQAWHRHGADLGRWTRRCCVCWRLQRQPLLDLRGWRTCVSPREFGTERITAGWLTYHRDTESQRNAICKKPSISLC